MKLTKVSMTKARKYNLGNYETRDVSVTIEAMLDDTNTVVAFTKLGHELDRAILREATDYHATNNEV